MTHHDTMGDAILFIVHLITPTMIKAFARRAGSALGRFSTAGRRHQLGTAATRSEQRRWDARGAAAAAATAVAAAAACGVAVATSSSAACAGPDAKAEFTLRALTPLDGRYARSVVDLQECVRNSSSRPRPGRRVRSRRRACSCHSHPGGAGSPSRAHACDVLVPASPDHRRRAARAPPAADRRRPATTAARDAREDASALI